MKKHHKNLLLGGLIGALTGLVVISVNQDSGQYQASLVAQNGTATTSTTPPPPPPPTPSPSYYSQPQSELDNVRNILNQSKNDYQNRESELKNFKGQDITNLNNLMGQWKGFLGQMESELNKLTETSDFTVFWDLNSQEDDKAREVSDEFQQAYGMSDLVNAKQQALKEKPKQIKDTERSLKDWERNAKKIQPAPDFTAVREHFAQMQNIVNQMQVLANTQNVTDPKDLAQQIWDLNRDFDDHNRDFWDAGNEINEKANQANQLDNYQRNFKDKQRTLKDTQREINKISKTSTQEEVQALQIALQNMTDILSQIQTALTAGDVETLNDLDRTFWDANTDIQDLLQTGREVEQKASQMKEALRNLKDKSRQIKDMERECKRNKCENSEAGQALQQLRDLRAQMQEAADAIDPDTFWDLNSQFDESNRTFWDLNQVKSQQKDVARWLKDVIREWNDKEKMINQFRRDAKRRDSNISIEGVENAQVILEEVIPNLESAKQAFESGDTETAKDILENVNDSRMEFDEIVNGFNRNREVQFNKFELEKAAKDIDDAEKEINKKLERGRISQEKADTCLNLVAKGKSLLEQWRQVIEGGQIGEFEGDQKQIEIGLKTLEGQFMKNCGDVIDLEEKGPDTEGYVEVFVEDQYRDTANKIFEGIKAEDVVNQLVDRLVNNGMFNNLFNSLTERLNQISQKFEEEVARSFEEQTTRIMESTAALEQSYMEELISRKTAMMEQLEQKHIDEKIAKEIADYNFFGKAGDQLMEELQKGSIDSKRIATYRNQARVEKYESGYIPFRDVDDNDWYLRFVKLGKDRGIWSGRGDTGNFDPGARVTVGEILKMALNASGVGESDEEPRMRLAADDWAKGYIAQAENLELNIMQGLQSHNRPATRAEVVRIILEINDIEPSDVDSSSFIDVPANHPHLGYIEKARELVLVSGDSTTNKFRPDDPVNRAEAAKIIMNAVDLIIEPATEDSGEEDFSDDEDSSDEDIILDEDGYSVTDEDMEAVPTI